MLDLCSVFMKSLWAVYSKLCFLLCLLHYLLEYHAQPVVTKQTLNFIYRSQHRYILYLCTLWVLACGLCHLETGGFLHEVPKLQYYSSCEDLQSPLVEPAPPYQTLCPLVKSCPAFWMSVILVKWNLLRIQTAWHPLSLFIYRCTWVVTITVAVTWWLSYDVSHHLCITSWWCSPLRF